MRIAVVVAPVIDPLIAARQLKVGADGDLALQDVKHVMGPFDEAALEMALALRAASPDSIVSVLVFGGAAANEALRYAIALKADTVRWIAIPAALAWDARKTAASVADAISALESTPDLVLMGPEFGDRDDGMVAPLVAKLLDRLFFAWAYRARADEAGLMLARDTGEHEERLIATGPVLATVSTHPSIRLRLPLLKNILAANRQQVANETSGTDTDAQSELIGVSLESAGRTRGGNVRMLEGSLDDRAAELARLIRAKVRA